MSLASCSKCLNTPCTCGWDYLRCHNQIIIEKNKRSGKRGERRRSLFMENNSKIVSREEFEEYEKMDNTLRCDDLIAGAKILVCGKNKFVFFV